MDILGTGGGSTSGGGAATADCHCGRALLPGRNGGGRRRTRGVLRMGGKIFSNSGTTRGAFLRVCPRLSIGTAILGSVVPRLRFDGAVHGVVGRCAVFRLKRGPSLLTSWPIVHSPGPCQCASL